MTARHPTRRRRSDASGFASAQLARDKDGPHGTASRAHRARRLSRGPARGRRGDRRPLLGAGRTVGASARSRCQLSAPAGAPPSARRARRRGPRPIQLSPAASPPPRGRRHAGAQLVVLAAGRGELGRLACPARRDLRDARGERQRAPRRARADAARLGEPRRVRAPGRRRGRASRARRRGERAALGEPRPRPQVAGDGSRRPSRAALEHRQAGRRAAEGAGDADEVARLRAVAADQPVVRSAQPTTVTAIVSAGPPPGRRRRSSRRNRRRAPRRPRAAPARRRRQLRRQHDPEVRLAGVGAHRRDVGERAGERAPARVVGLAPAPSRKCVPSTMTSTETTASAPRAHDGGVVAEPAHDARARPGAPSAAPIASIRRELATEPSGGGRRSARG